MYIHKLNLKKTKFMNKMILNRLTMLAVTLMASMACFAQGKSATGWTNSSFGPDYQELTYDVLGSDGCWEVQVAGFASSVVNDPKIMLNPPQQDDVTIIAKTVAIPHYLTRTDAQPVFNGIVKEGAFANVSSELANNVTTLTIDFKGNTTTAWEPVKIKDNAFTGLTKLTTVKSLTPGEYVKAIPTDAFATSVYEDATLVVPTGSMPGYANTDGWSNFYTIVNADGYEHGDVNIDNKVNKTDITIFRKWLNDDDDVDYDKILDEEDLDFNNDGKVNKTDITALRNWMNRD